MKPGQVIVIRDFDEHFVVAQNARIKGPLTWVAVPTKHDGKSFRRIMQLDHGAAIYGAWHLLLQIGAKCTPHGMLADADGPLTIEDIELKTGCPSKVLREAVEVLSSKGIGWLELVEHSERATSALGARSTLETGRDGTRRNEMKSVRTEGGSESEKLASGDDASTTADAATIEIACLRKVQDSHLGNTLALVELANRIRHDHPGFLPDGHEGLLRLIAAAERAKSQGKQPSKLFRWIIRNERWDLLDGQEKALARKRIAELEQYEKCS